MNLPSLARLMTIAILLAGSAARAQIPTESEVRQAAQHTQKGRALFDAGRYQKAVQEFQAAYKLEPDPQLQYSIGEANRLNDADQAAIAAYRRYLELAPDGSEARNAHRHLRELGAERKQPRMHGKAIAAPAPVKSAPPPEPAPPIVSEPPPQPARVDLVAPPPERHPRAPLSKRNKWIIIGASAGAAAVIVLGVGLGVGLQPHETAFTEVRP